MTRIEKVVHIISSLDIGGAETALLRLCREQVKCYSAVTVISLQPKATLHDDFIAAGVKVICLNMSHGWQLCAVLLRLRKLLQELKPDVLHSWMYYANFISGIAKIGLAKPLIWSVRRTAVPVRSLFSRLFMRSCAWLSYLSPSRICFNAQSGKKAHLQFGYAQKKSVFIGNGFDFSSLEPDPEIRQKLRSELGITNNMLVIACVGRWHKDKGQDILLSAMAEIMTDFSHLKLVMIGRGCDNTNVELTESLTELKLSGAVLLCGEKIPVAPWFNVGDIFCLPSRTEGFPNALAEAMATALPCVSTKVGDATEVGAGFIFLANPEPKSLAAALRKMLNQPKAQRLALAESGRDSVVRRFSIVQVAAQYHDLYLDVLER